MTLLSILRSPAASGANFDRSIASSVAQTSAATRSGGFARTDTNSVAHTSAASRALALVRADAENVTHTSAATRSGGFVRALAASIAHSATTTGVRAPGGGADFPRSMASSVAHSAALAREVAFARSQASAVVHTSTALRAVSFGRRIAIGGGTFGGGLFGGGTFGDLPHGAVLVRQVAAPRPVTMGVAPGSSVVRAGVFGRGVGLSLGHLVATSGFRYVPPETGIGGQTPVFAGGGYQRRRRTELRSALRESIYRPARGS